MSSKRPRGGAVDSAGTLLPIIGSRPWNARRISHATLRHNARALGRTFRHQNKWTWELREPCSRLVRVLGARSDIFTTDRNIIPVILRLAAYRGRWVREPESWEGDAPITSLIHHLFALYPVSPLFEAQWFASGPVANLGRDSYCHLAQGGSAKALRQPVGTLSKRAMHLFLTDAPADLSISQAMRWAQAVALGASDGLARIFATSRMNRENATYPIWQQFMEMVIKSGRRGHLGMMIDHLAQRLNETWPEDFNLKGTTLEELTNAARQRFRKLQEIGIAQGMAITKEDLYDPRIRAKLIGLLRDRWDPMPGIPSFSRQVDSCRYEVTELCSQQQLTNESKQLRHCVETYAHHCRSGNCALFSLRLHDSDGAVYSVVTVDVNPRTREVWQARCGGGACPGIAFWVEVIGVAGWEGGFPGSGYDGGGAGFCFGTNTMRPR